MRVPLLALQLLAGAARAQDLAPTRVALDSLPQLTALASAGYEVAGVEEVAGRLYATVVATATQRALLAAEGLTITLASIAAGPRPPPVHYRDVPAVYAALEARVAAGQPLVVDTIGRSWEQRPIVSVKVGPPDDAPSRPNVLYLGAHHAREWISVEMALQLLEYLLDSLPRTAGGAALLASRDIWVVPIMNPDGYQYSIEVERFWRKNRRRNDDGTFGVDLNRNYPAFWGHDGIGSSGATTAETYRGPAPASEPEVQAVMGLHAAHPPDVSISYHSYTNLVLFPYGFTSGRLTADHDAFTALAGTPLTPAIVDRLPESARASYHPGPGWQLYPTNGEYTEWAYRTHGTVAFTVELTAGCCVAGQPYGFEFPDDSAAIRRVVADNLPFALALLEDAGDLAPESPTFESVWPEIRLVGPAGSPARSVDVQRLGSRTPRTLLTDSLDRGTFGWRWRGELGMDPTGVEVRAEDGLARVAVVAAEGAERPGSGWAGWTRDSVGALEGTRLWRSVRDTLRSPDLSLGGVRNPQLVFWTQHTGSLFLPDRFGVVEYSVDQGRSWAPLARVEGSGPEWYPVRVGLPPADRVRLRFVPSKMTWSIDAIQIMGTPVSAALQVAEGELNVSENPVRSSRVFFTWASTAGEARLSVFNFRGKLVHRAEAPASDGVLAWDLSNMAGEAVDNGAYLAVLEANGTALRRRLFVARAP